MARTFTRGELELALQELAEGLAAAGVEVGIRLVGGAAVALTVDSERTATHDVDAVIVPQAAAPEVRAVVAEMAARRGWDPDWLNDAAAASLPFAGNPLWQVFTEAAAVRVWLAPADLLLAMKLNAARGSRDNPDIRVLLRACSIKSRAEAERLFDAYYPGEDLKPRARAILDAVYQL